jgi:hypothetical protein
VETFAFWLRIYWRLAVGVPLVFVSVWLMFSLWDARLALGFLVPFALGFAMAARDVRTWNYPQHHRDTREDYSVYGLGFALASAAAVAPIALHVLQAGWTERNLIFASILGLFLLAYLFAYVRQRGRSKS